MIKNLVFDIGNVLVDYKPVEFLGAKGYDPTMIKRIVKASVMSPYWEAFERADLTEEEAIKAFASLDPEIGDEFAKAYDNVHGMLTIRDFACDWIKSLKDAGYITYYLSNYSKKAYDECHDSLAFMEYMEGGILSHKVRLTKPDPEIYKLFLQEYAIDPKESVFIDDTPKNVAVAEEFGFTGIVFESLELTIQKLKELGVA